MRTHVLRCHHVIGQHVPIVSYLIVGQVFVAEREIKNVLVEGIREVYINCVPMKQTEAYYLEN